MADLRDRASALAGELSELHQEARSHGHHELAGELREVDRRLRAPQGTFTVSAYQALESRLREETYEQARAKVHAQAVTQANRTRTTLWHQLQQEARTEAEAVLQNDRDDVDRDRENLQHEAIQLEARDATISARETTWTRQRNCAVALGAIPAAALTTIIHTMV